MVEHDTTGDISVSGTPVGSQADFVTTECGACALLIRSEFHEEKFERALVAGELALREQPDLKRIPSAASSRVFRFSLAADGGNRRVYFKEYVDRSVWDSLKHTIRASRARRAFRASLMLAAQGFDAPQILALGETHKFFGPKRCFLATFEVAEAQPVFVTLSKDSSRLSTESLRRKRDLIRMLGHTVGQMHRCSIVHGDLRLGNVLARYENERWEFFFLDNERTRRWPWLPARLRLKNLVQANMIAQGVTTTDRFRFFRAYLSACPELRPCYKWWARKIHARTLERRDRYRRRGHMVRV